MSQEWERVIGEVNEESEAEEGGDEGESEEQADESD